MKHTPAKTHKAKTTAFGTPYAPAWKSDHIAQVEKTELKLHRRICGARMPDNKPCRCAPRHANGRCRRHGGFKRTGAQPGNKNAIVHGLYSQAPHINCFRNKGEKPQYKSHTTATWSHTPVERTQPQASLNRFVSQKNKSRSRRTGISAMHLDQLLRMDRIYSLFSTAALRTPPPGEPELARRFNAAKNRHTMPLFIRASNALRSLHPFP